MSFPDQSFIRCSFSLQGILQIESELTDHLKTSEYTVCHPNPLVHKDFLVRKVLKKPAAQYVTVAQDEVKKYLTLFEYRSLMSLIVLDRS